MKNSQKYDAMKQKLHILHNYATSILRSIIIPREGKYFITSDFSAIESRVLAWLADEEWKIEEYNNEGKVYEAMAELMFHIPKNDITKKSKERTLAKGAELACGYGGGHVALAKFISNALNLSMEERMSVVRQWRQANKKITKCWSELEELFSPKEEQFI